MALSDRLIGGIWVGLIVLSALPLPIATATIHTPEQILPIVWLYIFGFSALAVWIGQTSLPLGLAFGWMVFRTVYGLMPWRSVQVLSYLLCAGVLYVLSVHLPKRTERWVVKGILVAAGVNAVLGTLNIFGIYPGLWIMPSFSGWPVGLLVHPNYWGLYIATTLPIVWACTVGNGHRKTRWRTVGYAAIVSLWWVLVLSSRSRIPAIVATVGLLALAWPVLTRRGRMAVGAVSLAAIGGIFWYRFLTHGWMGLAGFGGRWDIWAVGLQEWSKHPLTGQGLGMWRNWAVWADGKLYASIGPMAGYMTEAYNEPLQLLFETGLIGVALWTWFGWHLVRDALVVWSSRSPMGMAFVVILLMTALAMWFTITFHWPSQAFVIMFAAGRVQARAGELRHGTA